jgi:tetratricopeptide (TPR) repeat protein
MFEAAIARDPTAAGPHAWLAKWYIMRIGIGISHDSIGDSKEAIACADRALQCDSDDALALAVDALVSAWSKHDLDTAERRLARALNCNPNEPLAWLWNAMVHAWRGRGREAVEAATRALSLSPLDPLTYYFNSLAGTANLVGERYSRAIELSKLSLCENCLHTPSLRTLAVAQVLVGQIDEARETVCKLRILEPGLTAKAFRARYPGQHSPQANKFAAALHAAGLPE